jgi:hypothetical protein
MLYMPSRRGYPLAMTQANPTLILDLLSWLAAEPRTYAETMEAWRTSCPRLTIWEDAVDAGYVVRLPLEGEIRVEVTKAGRRALAGAARKAA